MQAVKGAFNARDFNALASVLHRDFSAVTADQQRFTSLPAFRSYWENLFQGVFKRVTVNPTADELTSFLGEDVGLSTGTSTDTWELTNGDSRVMNVRWTAIVQKVDGQWKVRAVHIGTNLLDNPVLHAAKRTATQVAIATLMGGLVVGGLLGVLIGRRRSAKIA
jgi:ketosteroid isomerase-like protein